MTISRRDDGSLSLSADRLPGGVWGSNLRAILPTSRWVALSRETARRADQVCEVCSEPSYYGEGTRNPDCHEIWAFDHSDGVPVQRLAGVVALCGACHETQHSGLAELNGRTDAVIHTLMRVNGWSREDAVSDIARSADRYNELSRWNWALDLRRLGGWLTLAGKPALVIGAEDRDKLGNTHDKQLRKLSILVGATIPPALWEW